VISALMKSPYLNSLPLIVKVRLPKSGSPTTAPISGVIRLSISAWTSANVASAMTRPTAGGRAP
jgi:hypothetical protein